MGSHEATANIQKKTHQGLRKDGKLRGVPVYFHDGKDKSAGCDEMGPRWKIKSEETIAPRATK